MRKFLNNDDLNASSNIFRKNCRKRSSSSFFYFIILLKTIFLLLSVIPENVSSQQNPDFNQMAFQNMMSLRFDEASQNLKKSSELNPDNPYSIFLENYLQFIHCAIDGDDASYQTYKANHAGRTQMLKDDAGDAALYLLAEMNFHSFLLAMYHQQNFQALKKLILSHSLLSHFLQQADDPDTGRKLQGMILIVLSAIPDEYAWISSIAGIKGNPGEGMAILEGCMNLYEPNSAEYLESIIIITLINSVFKQEHHSNFNYLSHLPSEYLENPLYRLVYVISASKSGHNDEVIRILETYHQNQNEHKICYFDYLYGEALLNRMDKNAEIPLQKFIKCSACDIYLKSAYRKLAWHYLIQGDTLSFESYRKLVLESGSMIADVDRQAYHEFALSSIPNTGLLKARLLFDGGYYQQARSLLIKKETREGLQNVYQQVEYSYRLARIYHQNNETDKAIRYYQLTFEKGMNHPSYYAVYSALQLGTIYERLGNTEKARSYYHKVIEIPEKSYGYRFRHSAREGIRRLDEMVIVQD